MVLPLVVAVVAAVVLFGMGPMLVTESVVCSRDSVDASGQNPSCSCTKCDADEVQAVMCKKNVPKELKVEIEGKLYSVPNDAEMVTRIPQGSVRKDGSLPGKSGGNSSSDNAKPSGSETPGISVDDTEAPAAEATTRPAGEHLCEICFGQDRSTVMLPCGHGGFCWDCGLQIYVVTKECPFCRSKIELLVPLDDGTRRYEGNDEFVSSAAYNEDGKPLVTVRSKAALMNGGELDS